MPQRRVLLGDALRAVPRAISAVPDAMSAALLAGVNPIQGLHAAAVGPVAGGLATSTRLLVVTTTSAAALAAGSSVRSLPVEDRAAALSLLTLLAGVALVAAGLVRLGRITRFVSSSVMAGFLTGVAANIVLGQLPNLVGAQASGSFPAARAVDLAGDPGRVDWAALATGLAALALLVVLGRTRLKLGAAVVALVVPTVVVALAGADVLVVDDVGDLPAGLPLPALPDLGLLSVPLVASALAVAAITLVQGAAVAESVPNAGGPPTDTDRDLLAQGAGGLAAGVFQGMPVGGSVGQTALNHSLGARTRWAAVASGLWLVVILAALSGPLGEVAMPTLAAVLIYAAVASVDPGRLATIWRTGPTSQVAMATTFVATLLLPIPWAVGIGVALSLLLQLNRDALDLVVVELVPTDDGQLREQPAPARLESRHVTLLDVSGSLFYAGARTLQAKLPDPAGTEEPEVILRLRHRTSLGSTFFLVMADYARQLHQRGGQLYLSGVEPQLVAQMHRAGAFGATGPVQVFEATDLLGESSRLAYADAEAWLVHHPDTGPRPRPHPPGGEPPGG